MDFTLEVMMMTESSRDAFSPITLSRPKYYTENTRHGFIVVWLILGLRLVLQNALAQWPHPALTYRLTAANWALGTLHWGHRPKALLPTAHDENVKSDLSN